MELKVTWEISVEGRTMARHRGTSVLITEGFVYAFQSNLLGPEILKIGMTAGDPDDRAIEVSRKFGLPEFFRVVMKEQTSNIYRLEKEVHRRLEKYHIKPGDHILNNYNLLTCTELFKVSLSIVKPIVVESLKGLSADESWCRKLAKNPKLIYNIKGVGNSLDVNSPDVRDWLKKLVSNNNQAVCEFTLRQIASGVKYNLGKTQYLYWSFDGKPKMWFDPTQPQSASILIHRNFDGDLQHWRSLLGEDLICYKYRRNTELRLILWKQEHFEGFRIMIDDIVPKSRFKY